MARRIFGGALLALSLLPVHWLLARSGAGQAGTDAYLYADRIWLSSMGLLMVLGLASLILDWGLGPVDPARMRRDVRDLVLAPSARQFGAFVALLAGLAAALAAWVTFSGRPVLVDTMTQLVHARYWAAGEFAAPVTDFDASWRPPLGVVTEHGWVSQYPPGLIALLSIGLRLHAPWLLGVVSAALAGAFSAWALEELSTDEDRARLRIAALAIGMSPFIALLAGAQMSHIPAAAVLAVMAWGGAKARSQPRFLLLAGGALGVALLIRPWSGLLIGAGILAATWRPDRPARRLGYVAVGVLPFLLVALLYNAAAFGAPLVTGYEAAQGPGHRPGFGTDPWGNHYGLLEAVGYLGSDVVALGRRLFETPIPALLPAGLWLVRSRSLSPGSRLLVLWAFAGLLATATYWHHSLALGPRLLGESAPAFAGLVALGLIDWLRPTARRWTARASLVALAGVLTLANLSGRYATAGDAFGADMRVGLPALEEPAIAFVHGPWSDRIIAELEASGVRMDRIQTAVRQVATCPLQLALDDGRALPEPTGNGSGPTARRIGPGSWIGVEPGATLEGRCAVQAYSDRYALTAITPLQWRHNLPGMEGEGVIVVRDLGWEDNQEVRNAYPDRTAYLVIQHPEGPIGRSLALPYAAGMSVLWGDGDESIIVPSTDGLNGPGGSEWPGG